MDVSAAMTRLRAVLATIGLVVAPTAIAAQVQTEAPLVAGARPVRQSCWRRGCVFDASSGLRRAKA